MESDINRYNFTAVGVPEGRVLARVSTMSRIAEPAETFWLNTIRSEADLIQHCEERAGYNTVAWVDFFVQGIKRYQTVRQNIGACACKQTRIETEEYRSKLTFMPSHSLILAGNARNYFDYTQMKDITLEDMTDYTKSWLQSYYKPSKRRLRVGPTPFVSPTTTALLHLLDRRALTNDAEERGSKAY